DAVRARLRPASGEPRLFIDPRCAQLTRALREYHFPPDRQDDADPVKDGPDHAADALRYLVINLDAPSGATTIQPYLRKVRPGRGPRVSRAVPLNPRMWYRPG